MKTNKNARSGALCILLSLNNLATTARQRGSLKESIAVTCYSLLESTQTAPRNLWSSPPADPSQRKFLSLESTERGIASMSADNEALRNAMELVHGWTDVAVPWMARSDHMLLARRFCVLAALSSE